MKKIAIILVLCCAWMAANAIPARPGWQTRTQADGTTIEVQMMGDEYYHYMINRDGQEVRETDGMYEVVGEAPTEAVARARRAQVQSRRMRQDVGTSPYPAPRGLLILVNFSDVQFQSAHTADVMKDLITGDDCQVNNGFGSAAQYFRDQSNGAYQPIFDVYGPVTLSNTQSYYGQNVGSGGDSMDKYAADVVIEACRLANSKYADLNFANYDWNNDGDVDFVYVIYAGKGEADGGSANTIWPHNYSIKEILKWKGQGTYSVYTSSDTKLDGKYLDNYAMSQELNGQDGTLAGNGTFCHEFGHVLGLPDFYDTTYGTNYSSKLTPSVWDVMDGGGYNGDGHCPPNYSAWEKYFMGWITPKNLGSSGQRLTLYPNGTEAYAAYQINEAGSQQAATKEDLNYYIECRAQKGWDTHLPAAGMLIWKVDFSASKWTNNVPNTEAGKPCYTIICSSGSKIGERYGAQNVFPYSTVKSWSGISGKPLKEITRNGNNIELVYISAPATFTVTWKVNGQVLETARYNSDGSEKLRLPSIAVDPCDGTELIGWTTKTSWFDPFELPDDFFDTPSGYVTKDVTYNAIFK